MASQPAKCLQMSLKVSKTSPKCLQMSPKCLQNVSKFLPNQNVSIETFSPYRLHQSLNPNVLPVSMPGFT